MASMGGAGTTWIVANYGSVTAPGGFGVNLFGNGGILTNAGSIAGETGVYMGGGGTVTNCGGISGTGSAVEMGNGGKVTNNAGASVSSPGLGVSFVKGATNPSSLTNSGTIAATANADAVYLGSGSTITNLAAGSMSGSAGAIISWIGGGTIANTKPGSVTNAASAFISGAAFFGAGTLSNSDLITAAKYDPITGPGRAAAEFYNGGTVANDAGGSIAGKSFGIFVTGSSGTVSNTGSIAGDHGIALNAGGSVTNDTGASIAGETAGVSSVGAAVTLVNSGIITATGAAGADIEGGGSVTNLAGASISGSQFGVFISGGSGTVANAGTISGGSYAVDFASSGTNRLVVDPGAVFLGGLAGGGGAPELGSGTGSIEGVNTDSFRNFQTLVVDIGASWTLNGANNAPAVPNDGTITVAGSLGVTAAIDPSSAGVLRLDGGATLEVAAALGTQTQMQFLGGSELVIDAAGSFGINVGTASYAGSQLEDFGAGEMIDFRNFAPAGATLNYASSKGLLQVSNGAGQAGSLHFQDSSLGAGIFRIASDGAAGSLITHS